MWSVRRGDADPITGRHAVHTRAHPSMPADFEGARNPSAAPTAHELQFQQVLGLLRRRIRLIFTTVVLGTILAGVVGLLIPPQYTARTQVMAESQQLTAADGHAFVLPPSAEVMTTEIDTQVATLTSHGHLQRVLDGLREDPNFRAIAPRPATPPGMTATKPVQDPSLQSTAAALEAGETGALTLAELGRRLDIWLAPLIRRTHASALTFDDLERRLKVYQERSSRVITISFTWKNPRMAAAVANRVAQSWRRTVPTSPANCFGLTSGLPTPRRHWRRRGLSSRAPSNNSSMLVRAPVPTGRTDKYTCLRKSVQPPWPPRSSMKAC
jgi:hypothetical protein